MATTYGYGGEFSSDEDIEQSERMVQSRFNEINSRPSAGQLEETIEAIKNLSPDEDINLSDDILASLLDHYKTQRGPIVDSTRKLYKKIVLRIIRDGAKSNQVESNGNVIHNSGISSNSNNNNNNNNNDDDVGMIISKQSPQVIDSFSSDDEEPLTPVIQGTLKKKFETPAVAVTEDRRENDDKDDGVEQMDIDVQTPTGGVGRVRETKQVDISSDEDDDEDEDESSDESNSEELNSESDVLEVTPIKPPKQQAVVSNDKAKVAASALSKPRQAHIESSSSKRQQPLAHSTPKESVLSTAKKPYTRSQRARAVASNDAKASDSFINSKSAASSSNDSRHSSRKGYILLAVTLFVVLIAFLLYYLRENILKSTSGGRQPLSISFG